MTVPVLEDERTRKSYDTTWAFWPWEHPKAYWLRSNGDEIVCTRCGKSTATMPRALDDDPDARAESFTTIHLGCKLGHGMRGPRVEPEEDPLLAAS